MIGVQRDHANSARRSPPGQGHVLSGGRVLDCGPGFFVVFAGVPLLSILTSAVFTDKRGGVEKGEKEKKAQEDHRQHYAAYNTP